MTIYSIKSPHNYAYSTTLPANIQSRHGFKPVTVSGKKFYEFEHCGIATRCRPILGGMQVHINGCNDILEIHQPNHKEMVSELVTALAKIAPEYHRRRTLKNAGMSHLI